MKIKDLTCSSRTLVPRKSIIEPIFDQKTILAKSHWDYVEMYLKRKNNSDALFYWNQAEVFYNASLNLPTLSAPLTLYYCFLNAAKALLTSKNEIFSKKHGVSSKYTSGNTNLKSEIVSFNTKGILAALSRYFGDISISGNHTMWELLYNVPFIHRSFNLTYPSESVELFIPIKNLRFVISDFQHYGWFCFATYEPYQNWHTINKIKALGFYEDKLHNKFTVRYTKRFKWYYKGNKRKSNFTRLKNYHSKFRRNLVYISGNNTHWYIKRTGVNGIVDRNPACIIYAIMHRLSELSRYDPLTLSKHFEAKHNWLLTEFIEGAAEQFIDMIGCEITNSNIMKPGIR